MNRGRWKVDLIGHFGGMLLIMIFMTGCATDSLYELFTADPVVQFPKDEEAHNSGGEWWYYTGMLTADTGETFGVETVIFHLPGCRIGLPIIDGWVSHYAILNVREKSFTYDQSYLVDWFPGFSENDIEGFDLYTPQIQMTGSNGSDHISAAMTGDRYVLDLDLTDERGVILHGENGYVPYGNNIHAFYYSRPKMQASGSLTVGNRALPVQGELWFDRQWGRNVINPKVQWDWFSLRLDDGSCVMLFIFRGADPMVCEGTYIPASGDAVSLSSEDFTVTATDWWTSPNTKITYPVAWDITIAQQSLTLHVRAVSNNQEFDARATSANVYWEGLCTINGSRGENPLTGHAYVELTNY